MSSCLILRLVYYSANAVVTCYFCMILRLWYSRICAEKGRQTPTNFNMILLSGGTEGERVGEIERLHTKWNFMWMCSLCRLPVAKNDNFGQILTFGGLLYQTPFTDEGQILCAGGDPRYTLTYEISYVFFVLASAAQNHNFGQILTFGGSCTDPLLPIRSKLRADPW